MNRTFGSRGRIFNVFSTLTLFCFFALLSLAVLLFGARAYQGISERMDENFVLRTASSYIANKVRQHDAAGTVSLSEVEGIPALALAEGGGEYQTLIYYSGGAVRELFASKDITIDPDSGMEIVPAGGLSFERRGGGIAVSIRDEEGQEASLFLTLRSGVHN